MMALTYRAATSEDLPFLQEMLYEAVYWRSIRRGDEPPFAEGLASPGVRDALDGWGERDGDTAIIAMSESTPVGAGWYRYHTASSAIRGYIDDATPVVVLAVSREHRRLGVGTQLLTDLIGRGSEQGVGRLSLMVSHDNHAYDLYRKCGFSICSQDGDSSLMVRPL
jgi:ribosomal protein S18 acetylase RimI-like enzyme